MSRPQPGQEKLMNTPIESEKNAAAADVSQPNAKHAGTKKASKKAVRAKQPASRPTADRANKKAEVIALMKRAKGVTLAEIMAATKWQAHTVRGFVSILGSKGGAQIESSNDAPGERTYKTAQ